MLPVSTPLLLASGCGYAEVTRALLEHRADSEARDKNGWSPLERASAEGHVGIARVLLEPGADVKARDKDKVTPLHIASNLRQLAVARVLLEHGADVKADNTNQTPLHWARGEEVQEVPRFLLEQGENANALDIEGPTPLRLASEQGCGSCSRPSGARCGCENLGHGYGYATACCIKPRTVDSCSYSGASRARCRC
jgi:ankyrin repeat protein